RRAGKQSLSNRRRSKRGGRSREARGGMGRMGGTNRGEGAARPGAVARGRDVASAGCPRPRVRLRGRSLMAFVLTPELPVADWLAEFDAQLERCPAFFAGRPVIVDVSALPASDPGLAVLIEGLRAREIQVIAVESADPAWLGVKVGGLPAIASAGRSGRPGEVAELVSAERSPSTTA